MIIFSHRGVGFEKSENSIDSYKETLKQGFSLEIDVQKSRDGIIVLSHDANLIKQKEIDKNIPDMNYKELQELKIPLLSQVFEIFKKIKNENNKNQLIAIHIKDELQGNLVKLVLDLIKQNKLEEDVFIFDISTNYANHSKQLAKKIKIGLSVGERRYTETIYLWEDIKDNINFEFVWWDEWKKELYNKENFDEIKKKGKLVYAISPELHKIHNHPKSKSLENIKEIWKNLVRLKVDGICTDYPKELEKFLEDYELKLIP